MAFNYPGDIEALAISLISSDFIPGGVWISDGHWCRDQVGKGAGAWFFKRLK